MDRWLSDLKNTARWLLSRAFCRFRSGFTLSRYTLYKRPSQFPPWPVSRAGLASRPWSIDTNILVTKPDIRFPLLPDWDWELGTRSPPGALQKLTGPWEDRLWACFLYSNRSNTHESDNTKLIKLCLRRIHYDNPNGTGKQCIHVSVLGRNHRLSLVPCWPCLVGGLSSVLFNHPHGRRLCENSGSFSQPCQPKSPGEPVTHNCMTYHQMLELWRLLLSQLVSRSKQHVK